MTNHLQRILVALVGIPLIIFLSLHGGILFFLFISLLSAVGLHEYYALAAGKNAKPMKLLGIAGGFLVNLSFYYQPLKDLIVSFAHDAGSPIPYPSQTQIFFILTLFLVLTAMVTELFRNRGSVIVNVATTLSGILYVSVFFGTLIGLRELFVPADFPMGRYFAVPGSYLDPALASEVYRWGGYTVLTVMATIWICDSAAYYVGSSIGRHKLFPRISPNKSWEGAAAGFIFSLLAALAAKYFIIEYLTVTDALIMGVIVGLAGQVGDLAESALKRDAGVKDSSAILPGHGGVLDRFDSLLFSAPLVYFYLDFIVFS